MKTIIQELESQIPHGDLCDDKCPYLEKHAIKPGFLGYCDLMEEPVARKECGINESTECST